MSTLPNLHGKRLILASASPRRKQLLSGLNIPFETIIREVDEQYDPTLQREHVARYLAGLKADQFRYDLPDDTIVLTSDTTVYIDGQILNKPANRAEAIDMLMHLAGRTHTVITAVCLLAQWREVLFHDETHVTFSAVTPEEAAYYVDRYNPMDKAGAYGAQDFIGYIAIRHLDGSYYNVMGLPVHRVYEELKSF